MHFPYSSHDFFHFPRSNFIPKNQNRITINTSPTSTLSTTHDQTTATKNHNSLSKHTSANIQQPSTENPTTKKRELSRSVFSQTIWLLTSRTAPMLRSPVMATPRIASGVPRPSAKCLGKMEILGQATNNP